MGIGTLILCDTSFSEECWEFMGHRYDKSLERYSVVNKIGEWIFHKLGLFSFKINQTYRVKAQKTVVLRV